MKTEQKWINGRSCIDVLPEIKTKSADFIFCDPPYNCKKDYGVCKDDMSPTEYHDFMQTIITESIRIARKGIAFYVGGNLTKEFMGLMPPESHLIIVHKRAVGIMCNNYFLQYHSLFVTAPPIKKCKDLWDDIRLPGEGYFFREKRYPSPGLTSVELTKKVLSHFTVEGDSVLDPFLGSGTTMVACLELNRNCLGIEIDSKWEPTYIERLKMNHLKMDAWTT